MPSGAIQADHLTKRFGRKRAVDDLSLHVCEGEGFGFVGPNGAGKSTTIRCLMGFVRPTAGRTVVAGLDGWRASAAVHRSVGYVPGEVALPDEYTGMELLRVVGSLHGGTDPLRLKSLLERFDLHAAPTIRSMSKGTRQKVALVAALLPDPPILILDEPSSGLDPLMQQALIALLREERSRGKTLLLSSHIFHEIERTCDRVAMIRAGRLIAAGDVADLRRQQTDIFDITFADDAGRDTFIAADFDIVDTHGRTVSVALHGDFAPLFTALASLPVTAFSQRAQDLESSFFHFYAHTEEVS